MIKVLLSYAKLARPILVPQLLLDTIKKCQVWQLQNRRRKRVNLSVNGCCATLGHN